MIRLKDIHFIRNDRSILSDVDLEMKKGEQWVILGRNGSGKTTILELISGYQFPSKGIVEVNGFTYTKCDVREVRKKIGYISQTLLEKLNLQDPVEEIIATGEYGFLRFYEPIPQPIQEKALQMLEWVRLPHLVGQPLGRLSQGERKKILLARALMNDPSILIMDEPCAGLDLFEREQLLENIEQLRQKNINLIYVTHHIEEIMPSFTHICLLEEGKILKKGLKEEVLTDSHLEEAFHVPIVLEWFNGRPWIKTNRIPV